MVDSELPISPHNPVPNVEDVRARIAKFDIRSTPGAQDIPFPHVQRSSVLVPLFFQNGELNVLLTLRSPDLRHHPSMAALPGGRTDEEDRDDAATALREAEEEVGLPGSQVEVIGFLPPTFARPNYAVFPVVGLIPGDFRPKPNQEEVSLVFSAPLSSFLEDHETRELEVFGHKVNVHYFQCNTDRGPVTVWGVTAWFCLMVAGIVFQRDETEQFPAGGSGVTKDFMNTFKEHFIHMCESTKPAKL